MSLFVKKLFSLATFLDFLFNYYSFTSYKKGKGKSSAHNIEHVFFSPTVFLNLPCITPELQLGTSQQYLLS